MRAWNRARLLWGYLSRQTKLSGLPVEYIVETTAKCNLYCPMCPRETHKQPKQDMTYEIFQRLVQESGSTAEHMMLIGLGEPFMDPKIFERIEYFKRFWSAVPGVDQVRIKEDETNLMRPDAGHEAQEWKHPCHYLWRGTMYVKHNGNVYPCCQSYMLDGKPLGKVGAGPLEGIWNSEEM